MKTFIIAIAILISGTPLFAEGTSQTECQLGKKPECFGKGICKVRTKNENSQGLIVNWTLNTSQTLLSLAIADAFMAYVPADMEEDLLDGRFEMTESFTFPIDVAAALGTDDPLVIPAGTYTATRTGSGYVIQFSIHDAE